MRERKNRQTVIETNRQKRQTDKEQTKLSHNMKLPANKQDNVIKFFGHLHRFINYHKG